ncbi:MAG: magnesium transporter MgtE N-terminal domain-containing protein, partial [Alphaproteobacteria bacterium]
MPDTAHDTLKARPQEMRDVTSPEFLDEIYTALEQGKPETLRALVEPLHPADMASLLAALDTTARRDLITTIGADLDPEVLSEVDETLRAELVRTLGV